MASSVDAKNNVFVLRSTDGGLTFKKVSVVTNAPLIRGRVEVERNNLRRVRGQQPNERAPEAQEYKPSYILRARDSLQPGREVGHVRRRDHDAARRVSLSTRATGATGSDLDNGLIAHSFWGIRWLNGYLYLASDGQGVVRSTTTLQAVTRRR